MSITLGEKLRQAREERGISISEVAEQTRISALYIQSIENDDYRALPGGIFNKGFVKSFAKYVGVDEQEALQDYGALVGSQNIQNTDEPQTYRPQVLTDNHSSSSVKTIISAVVILGLMAFGILALKNYLEGDSPEAVVVNNKALVNSNADSANPANVANANTATASIPSMNDLKVEVKALNEPVSVSSTSDGKPLSTLMTPEKPLNFEPKQALKIRYAKSLASNVQMTLNGKQISLPATSADPKRNVVEFEITKDNLASIWQNGKISFDESTANSPR